MYRPTHDFEDIRSGNPANFSIALVLKTTTVLEKIPY